MMRLSYMLGTEPITMLPSPYLPDKCAELPAVQACFLAHNTVVQIVGSNCAHAVPAAAVSL